MALYASIAVPNASGQAGQWTWVPVTRWLAAGERQLKLKYRDGGVGIDCLLVTAPPILSRKATARIRCPRCCRPPASIPACLPGWGTWPPCAAVSSRLRQKWRRTAPS
jgi:heparin/heparan-sulfate lyase